MVNLTINGTPVSVKKGTTILYAAQKAAINIPTMCFMKGVNEIAACRICLVEIEGLNRLVASCNTEVEEGMVVYTDSPKVRRARKTNLELMLSQHECYCPTCVRSGNCRLQKYANDMGLSGLPYDVHLTGETWDQNLPLVRENKKCIKCMRCVQICEKVQTLGVWDVINTGARTTVGVKDFQKLDTSSCVLCGQCIAHCPVGALRARDDTEKVYEMLGDPDIITAVQIAPSIPAAWGEDLGIPRKLATSKKLTAALKQLGFDYVFDTSFSADLTIVEEGSEFLRRILSGKKYDYPMFTSCCPGWVRFVKSQYPELVPHLSTAKSPQQMLGAVLKTYFAQLNNIDVRKLRVVSIMPCVAKKYERGLPLMDDAHGGTGSDVDLVITTRELVRMIKSSNIKVASLEDQEFDKPLGEGSGAGMIFGASGGVMEAALRTTYFLLTGKNPQDLDTFKEVRGLKGWKSVTYNVADMELRVAVASGLGNVRRLIEAIKRGEVHYDFVEVMACPGGCSGGGGQPIHEADHYVGDREESLYEADRNHRYRLSHENPDIIRIYDEFLTNPLSEKAHELLHTDIAQWDLTIQPQ